MKNAQVYKLSEPRYSLRLESAQRRSILDSVRVLVLGGRRLRLPRRQIGPMRWIVNELSGLCSKCECKTWYRLETRVISGISSAPFCQPNDREKLESFGSQWPMTSRLAGYMRRLSSCQPSKLVKPTSGVERRTRFHMIGENKEAQLPLECLFASDLFHIDQHESSLLFGLDDLINQHYQQIATSGCIDIYSHRIASQIAAITYPAQTLAYHLFSTIPNFLPRNNAPMASFDSLATFTDAIMQSLRTEPSPHLLEVEAFLRDPMLPHHYTLYDNWSRDIAMKEVAGVEMAEIAARLQVSPFCCRPSYLIG
jgi:hypothetical protein